MRPILSILLIFVCTGLYSQTFNSVKIDLNGKSITELANLGLDVEHGQYAKDKHFIGVFSNTELGQIRQAGFDYKILMENLSDHVRNHHQDDNQSGGFRNPGPCGESNNSPELVVPENFDLGTFAGFFTYDEMLDNLDAMVAQYPNLITIKSPIDTFLSHEGRPIYWVKISDNPNDDETEPEILYTAVHHAREPGGMSGLIYFMWHILENYASDPQVQAMINETELYIVPCLNPDGYIFNEDNYFNGGSIYWRKNRRDNGDGTFGVDLNRNYGYEFGFDDNGSSPNPDAATYRGPSGFSEPETQASEAFCNAHEFQIALNYHSYGNLLIYPWGYDNIGIGDPIFPILANEMVAGNNFFPGTALETVGYFANGNSDDWMFGENASKPPIFAMTPELGLGGFYPPESEIMGIVQSALGQNMSTGLLAHSYAQVEDLTAPIVSSINPQDFNFKLTNIGLEGGNFAVTLSAVSDNFDAVGDTKNFNIPSQGSVEDFISFNLVNDIMSGEELVFVLSVDNGSYIIRDTISKIFGITEVLFSDAADNLDNWSSGSWATTTEDFVSSSTSMTDSPFGDYLPNSATDIISNPVSLSDAQGAFLNFWAKWDIETGWDYSQVSISIDGGITYEPQCGLYTKAGNSNQEEGQPIYDGTQSEWVKEQINLSDYLGQEIQIRFSLVSDNGVEEDGFYVDDVEVIIILDNEVATRPLAWNNFPVKVYPNPANDLIHLELSTIIPHSKLLFYNAQGSLVYEKNFENESLMKIPVQNWADGIYFYELLDTHSANKTRGKVFIE